ncbi:hypothetical protein [Streptomyces sp. NPDC001889]
MDLAHDGLELGRGLVVIHAWAGDRADIDRPVGDGTPLGGEADADAIERSTSTPTSWTPH